MKVLDNLRNGRKACKKKNLLIVVSFFLVVALAALISFIMAGSIK
jgi:hypothetical protein